MRALRQPCFRIWNTTLIVVPLVLSLTATAVEPSQPQSLPSKKVDEQVDSLVQELRDLPGDLPVRVCTPCNSVSKVVGAKRRREIYYSFGALGTAAVPELARMLQNSLRGTDKDLTSTLLWILGGIDDRHTDRDGIQHEKTDLSPALPALMQALNEPNSRSWAAGIIGSIGPKAAEAVPKLVALLGEEDAVVRGSACNGLRGIDPLPGLRQARSDPNPDKRQLAQRAIAAIETQCFAGAQSQTPLDGLASTADLVCKATVIADRPVSDDSFKPIYGFEVREAELRVVSSLKGDPPGVVRFRYYERSQISPESPVAQLVRFVRDYLSATGEPEGHSLTTGRTYLVLATRVTGVMYREMAGLVASSAHITGIGPVGQQYSKLISPGVLLAADAKPHHGNTLTEAAWNELLALTKSPRDDDVLKAIYPLDWMSGGPAWNRSGSPIFERDEALIAIEPLIEAKNTDIAVAAVTAFGGDSPYFYDRDVPFWLVGIGKGHITGLAARRRPANPVVADIGARELLQVAIDGVTPKLRALAIRALGRRPHAYPVAIVAKWTRDPNVEVRRAAVLASAEVPDRAPIVTATTDSSPELRETAAWAVGFAQDPHLLPLLDKLLHDPVAAVRSSAALSLLSYPAEQSTAVMKANLNSGFRPLFINALASADPQPYVAMLAEMIEHDEMGVYQIELTDWSFGGTSSESWQILFDFVSSRPADELTSGKLDSSLDALERVHWASSGEPTKLYALYVSRNLQSRARRFRQTTRNSAPFNMDIFFDRVDQDPWAYVP